MAELNATCVSLLGFLQHGPQTGWDLAAAVDVSIGNFWNVTRSQVYRELRHLAELGLVEPGEVVGNRERRPYTITDAGRAAFVERIGEQPGDELIRIPLLLTMFFGSQVDPDRLRRFLQAERVKHQRRLDEYTEILGRVEGDRFVSATVRFGIGYETTVLQWLDDELGRVAAELD